MFDFENNVTNKYCLYEYKKMRHKQNVEFF